MTMKRTIIKLFFLVLFAGTSFTGVHAFDFSSVCGTGQTLYYSILSDSTVSVVYPHLVGTNYYSGYSAPSGSVQIPTTVVRSGVTYSVVAIGNNAFSNCTSLFSMHRTTFSRPPQFRDNHWRQRLHGLQQFDLNSSSRCCDHGWCGYLPRL